MASKFVVNAAFKARLLLRSPRQRDILPRTTLKPEYPTLQTLSSRSYSDSTSTPSPKPTGSPEGSQSSGSEHKRKNWFSPAAWDNVWSKVWTGVLAGGLATVDLNLTTYATRPIWGDWYQEFRRRAHKSRRESAIYDQLKKGPIFKEAIEYTIPRGVLVERIRHVITPKERSRLYPLIVGEHETGKTSLIKLAVNGMDEPKGVVYVNIPIRCGLEADVTREMQKSLGWDLDELIDPSERNYCGSFNNGIFGRSFARFFPSRYQVQEGVWESTANRLAKKLPELLDLFQDYAKDAADKGTAVVVFVSSEGQAPRRMAGRSSWSRRGNIIEIGDVSKEEALQYLKLRNIDGELAAQIYHLAGGRMIHLKFIVDTLEENGAFEAACQMMLNDAKRQLLSAEVYPACRYHKEGAMIIRELLKKGSISWDAFHGLVGIDTGNKLLEANIFAFHLNSQEITFQSTAMKRFCEEIRFSGKEMNKSDVVRRDKMQTRDMELLYQSWSQRHKSIQNDFGPSYTKPLHRWFLRKGSGAEQERIATGVTGVIAHACQRSGANIYQDTIQGNEQQLAHGRGIK
ncbi:uncharacterized protein Z518_07020 [Rhinocladiella mackenziei CBS 650.93]|uniref:ATPase domain-containing protein n=1 Tax=Rhinocladiella mackenziei CBS 650.93 TaxID=1442369 RepID=A0A0D2GZ87_9EURO|nr:uncharacterized protein Z518_07020 [Rhinocladiella mackenziei CBS 650.93]KIX03468.1 hypothetical protein Z518_07020 [Rhinocladiella mackenziei CBS 650.93]